MAQAHESITSQLEGAKSGMLRPHPLSPDQNTSDSLLGNPPSLPEDLTCEKASVSLTDFVEVFEERFDDAVASIYVSTLQDPLSYIIEEKLDDKEVMLMDVPNMPPPTAHPREPIVFPEGMQTFVISTRELGCLDTANHGSNGLGPMAFLRPVKGIKPLALDLSWRPFNFGKTIPTDEEVAGIAKSVQPEDEGPGYPDDKYEKSVQILLDVGGPPTPAEEAQPTLTPTIPRGCEGIGTSPTSKPTEESEHVGYLLTQRERLRASGTKITLDAEVEIQDDVDTEPRITRRPHNDEHEAIPVQNESPHQHEEHQGLKNSFDLMVHCSGTHSYAFDDSGIDITDDNVGQFSTSEFTVLSHPLPDDPLYAVVTLAANKENIDNQSEDKENVPPWDVDDHRPVDHQFDPLVKQSDWSVYFEFPESETPSFEPLPFASQGQPPGPQDNLANLKALDLPPPTPSGRRVKRPEDDLFSSRDEQVNSRATKRRKLDDLVPASSKDLFFTFMGLRNRTIEHSETRNDTPTPDQILDAPEQISPRAAPDDVFDQRTVRLPERWIPPVAVHRYLVSMTFIQKRALVRELQGHHSQVVLVERHDLGGTDIIIDPDHGVLFIPLLALPANIESTAERISGESWRYSRLLIVFEAFPSAQSYWAGRSQNNRPIPYAYTLPICKAVKKLRRYLGIAEGFGTMNSACTVAWAFADDVEGAAKFVRCFGEEACASSTEQGRGLLWDEREWLEEDEREGESDLARVQGMNAFAAFVMLYDRSLETILDLSPETRLAEFGPLLGQGRMIGLNDVIESRLRQIGPDIAGSVVDPEC